jgi:hypothetical protein
MSYQSDADAPFSGTADWLIGAVKNNPEGLLLVAAGCALLMRSKTARSGWAAAEHTTATAVPAAQAAAGTAVEAGWNVAERAKEAVSSSAAAVSAYARDTGRAVGERSTVLAQQLQDGVFASLNSVVQNQPLVLPFVGLAVGAAVAAMFSPIDLERRALGPTAERIADAAARAGERVKRAAAHAGERLKDEADERGLTAEGLKNLANETAAAFGEAFSEPQEKPAAPGRPPAPEVAASPLLNKTPNRGAG